MSFININKEINIPHDIKEKKIGLVDMVGYRCTFYDAIKREYRDNLGKSKYSLINLNHYKGVPSKSKSTISVYFGDKYELNINTIYDNIYIDKYEYELKNKNIKYLVEEYDLIPSRILDKNIKTEKQSGFKNRSDYKMYISDKLVNVGIFSNSFHITGCVTIKKAYEAIYYMYTHLNEMISRGIEIFTKSSKSKELADILKLRVEEYLVNSAAILNYAIDKEILGKVVNKFNQKVYRVFDKYDEKCFFINDSNQNCKARIKIPYAVNKKTKNKDHCHTCTIFQTGSIKISSKNSRTIHHAYQCLEYIFNDYKVEIEKRKLMDLDENTLIKFISQFNV